MCKNNEQINLRISAEQMVSNRQLHVELPKLKLHVFDERTGKRVGEWRG